MSLAVDNILVNTSGSLKEPIQPFLDLWTGDSDIINLDIKLIPCENGIQAAITLESDDRKGCEITDPDQIASILDETNWDAGEYTGLMDAFVDDDWYLDRTTMFSYRVMEGTFLRTQLVKVT